MPDYDISPSQVDGVLAATHDVGMEFETHAAALETDLSGSLEQAGSEPIAAALTGWFDTVRPDLLFLPDRTRACIQATITATNAYFAGDAEMAANAQESAWSAPDPRGIIPAGRLPR